MLPCAANNCTHSRVATVRTVHGLLDVCAVHEDILRKAGVVLAEAPAIIPIIVGDDPTKQAQKLVERAVALHDSAMRLRRTANAQLAEAQDLTRKASALLVPGPVLR